MKIGQFKNHKRYGKVRIDSIHRKAVDFNGGMTLEILTPEGRELFKKDRGCELPRYFEEDFSQLERVTDSANN